MKTKKLFLLGIVCVMLLAMLPVKAMAEEATGPEIVPLASGLSYATRINANYLLNAATDGTPVDGTNVTVWSNTGHATQRWTQSGHPRVSGCYYMRNDKDARFVIARSGFNCFLKLANDFDGYNQAIKYVFEGMYAGRYTTYGLVLPEALMCVTSTNASNGSNVGFYAPNGSSSQLWVENYY